MARKIFCKYAFDQEYPKDGFEMLVEKVIKLAGELPLGLRVIGSYFKGMSKQEWKRSMPRLETSLDANIHSILKFSYDALDDDDKDLFLYIACFFNGETIGRMEDCLATKFLEVRQRLNVLTEKSLISLNYWEHVAMDTLLVRLGREIVHKQSIHERMFLIEEEEIFEVLSREVAGSRKVIGIRFNYDDMQEEFDISERAFEGMSNLQFLYIYASRDIRDGVLNLPRGLKYLSRKLRVLHWFCLPLTCLPSTVSFEFLVELILQRSELEKLWDGNKPLRNLKIMDLSWSKNLRELPDLSTATNLLDLVLSGCISLVELPTSIGYAKSLEKLILGGCSELIKLPACIENATNLKELNLGRCKKLLELPSFIWNAINLQELYLSVLPNLLEVPSSTGNLTSLEKLYLVHCKNLRKLPSSIGNLHKLEVLDLHGCDNLSFLPDTINLESV